jgi:hypothetical protein
MRSILSLIIKPEYTIIGGNIDLKKLCSNPNPKIAKLIMKNPNHELISSNPNPGLTKFIIKNRDKINKFKLISNTNSMLADLIISFYPLTYGSDILNNSNSGLTELLSILNVSRFKTLSNNTNPKLAHLIMNYSDWLIDWSNISGNHNTGLTDFILSHPHNIDYHSLSKNTNPLLAELIIKNKHRLYWPKIFGNPNTGLTNFIIENYSHNYKYCLAYNSNPDLTDFIISKLKPEEIPASNTNKKLIKYMLLSHNSGVGLSANPSAVVIKKIEL